MGAASTNDERAPGEGFLVLWAGSAEIVERDTQVELRRAGVRVEVASVEELADRANERAPDLVVLGGEPGEDPEPIAARLRERSPACAAPVVALAPSAAAAPRPRARFGLVARLDREAEPSALAAQIGTLLEGLSTRPAVWRVPLRDGDLGAMAKRIADSGRAGILVARGAAAVAVEAGGAVAPGLARVTLTDAHFHERAPGRVRVAWRDAGDERAQAPSLEGLRVLVVDGDEARRARVAKQIEQARAQVRAIGSAAQTLAAGRAFDPSAVVVSAAALGPGALTPLWTEPRIASAPLLVLDGEGAADGLASEIASLARAELELARALMEERAVAERLETLGAARWLKLLGRFKHEVTLRVFAAAGRVRVDLAGGRIQGAAFHPKGRAVVEGRAAVDALMGLSFGRVLAGPPAAIVALEGASARRKPSVLGKMEPGSWSAAKRSPLVAEEVVVKRTDATKLPLGAAKPMGGKPEPAKDERSSLVPLVDLGDEDDDATHAYRAGVLDELRASLRSEAVTAPPPTRSGKVRREEDAAIVPAVPPRLRGVGASSGVASANLPKPAVSVPKPSVPKPVAGFASRAEPGTGVRVPKPVAPSEAEASADVSAASASDTPPIGDAAAPRESEAGAEVAESSASAPGPSVRVPRPVAPSDSKASAETARVPKPIGSVAAVEASANDARPIESSAIADGAASNASESESSASAAASRVGETTPGTSAAAPSAEEPKAGVRAPKPTGSAVVEASAKEAKPIAASAIAEVAASNASEPASTESAPPSTASAAAASSAAETETAGAAHAAARSEPRAADAIPASSAEPSASSGRGGLWLALGTIVALAVGGWAAWRLHGDGTASTPPPRSPSSIGAAAANPGGEQADPQAAPHETSAAVRSDDQPAEAARDPAEPAEAAQDAPGSAEGGARAGGTPGEGALAERGDEATTAAPANAAAVPSRDVRELIEAAFAATQRRDYALAETMARRALEVSPRNPRAGYRLAVALFRQQRYDEALRQATEVTEWDPRDPLPHALRGDILSRRGRFHEAARAYRRALEVEPRFGPAERSLERLRARGIEVPP